MIPTSRSLYFLLVLMVCSVIISIWPQWYSYWLVLVLIFAGFSLLDITSLVLSRELTVSRQLNLAMPVGQWSPIEIDLYNPKLRALKIELTDFYPDFAEQKGLGETLRLESKTWTKFIYHIKPNVRGNFQFGDVQYRLFGPFEFWKRNIRVAQNQAIRVYPDFAKVIEYELLVHEQRQGMLGIKKLRRRGEGLEFDQLREYRLGDMIRQIDWNATSRKNKLISREYQDERDQRVIFLIDCGRRMLAKDDGLSHFDQTLNAALLLSYVALRQGDSIGLMTFSGEHRWFSPRKGANTVNTLLNTVYDIQPSEQEADYITAAKRLMATEKKRALVIVLTNIRDEDTDELSPAIRLLKKRHAVLIASMREKILDVQQQGKVQNIKQAMQAVAIENYKQYREKMKQKLLAQGIFLLDVNPEKLAISLVNSYFKIKSESLL